MSAQRRYSSVTVGPTMNVTRRLRSLLAGARHGMSAVVAVMFLVLTVAGVHAVCSVHLDEHTHGAAHSHGDDGAPAAHGEVRATAVQADALEPVGGSSSGCSDHERVTAQSDPLLLPAPVLATMPEPTAVRLAPTVVHRDHRTASTVTASAPSLHALGISRT